MKKIRVGLETSVATFSSGGTARYAVELWRALCQISLPDLDLVELSFGRRHQYVQAGLQRKLRYLFWEKIYCTRILPRQMRDLQLDVLHAAAPLPLSRQVREQKTRIVTTIHDVIAFSNPEWFSRVGAIRTQQDTKRSADASEHLIADSNATKKELVHWLGVAEDRVTTIYPGSSISADPVSKTGVEQPFLISVGTLEPRKNLVTVLEGYAYLKNEIPDPPKLALVGRSGWGDVPLAQVISKYGLQDSVLMLGHVTDTKLAALYASAEALVYPSLAEGFGLPVVEAMAYGCPVITSNISSLPEIAGDAAVLIDPRNPHELCQAMVTLLKSAEQRQALSRCGIQRAARFSWETCAEQTADVYRTLVKRTSY